VADFGGILSQFTNNNPGLFTTTTTTAPGPDVVIQPGQAAVPDRTIPGSTPDYSALVKGDPLLAQELADLSAGGIQSQAQRDQAIKAAIINFGAVPTLGGDLAGIVDPLTSSLAEKNTQAGLSLTSRLDAAHQAALSNMQYALAARGMTHSGAVGVGAGLEGEQYKQARFDATNQLLNYLAGVQSAFAEAQRQQALAANQAREGAFGRAVDMNPPTAPYTVPGHGEIPPVTMPGDPVTTTTKTLDPTILSGSLPKTVDPGVLSGGLNLSNFYDPTYDPYAHANTLMGL
jgi:hypothetical protein